MLDINKEMNIAIHSLIVSIDSFNFNTILNRYYNSLPNINEVIEYNESVDCLSEKHCYRLSLRNTSTSYIHEIPNADNHSHVDKIGYLQKQYGMTFPYLSQWRRRYCVLKKGLMYLYEKDTSKGNERTNLVIDLKYFDLVTEALQKDAKKGLNVFLVASDSDRRFFDPGRHRFAAESPSEMQDWITKIRHSIELSRNNNKLINEKKPKEPIKEINRKSDKGGPKDETNESSQKEMSDKAREKQMSGKLDLDNKEIKPVENVDSKFQKSNEALFQESTQPSSDVNEVSPETEDKPPSPDVDTRPRKQSSKKIVLQPPSIDLHTKPCLESITKHRIKGPSGRRAPQTRPSVLMKQRASSMSALLQEELPKDDTRSEYPLSGHKSVHESPPGRRIPPSQSVEMNIAFDDIESALFFKKLESSPLKEEESDIKETVDMRNRERKRRKTFSLRNLRLSRSQSRSRDSPKDRIYSLFRKPTFKFSTFRTSTCASAGHPDEIETQSKCSVL